MDEMRSRLAHYLPVTAGLGLRKAWAATIDYTPDHQPILGPALMRNGDRIAADLALEGRSAVADVTDLGLDRFDEHGRSRLATDPIALPFPTEVAWSTPTTR